MERYHFHIMIFHVFRPVLLSHYNTIKYHYNTLEALNFSPEQEKSGQTNIADHVSAKNNSTEEKLLSRREQFIFEIT